MLKSKLKLKEINELALKLAEVTKDRNKALAFLSELSDIFEVTEAKKCFKKYSEESSILEKVKEFLAYNKKNGTWWIK